MPFQKGNRLAKKEVVKDAILHIRVTPQQKAAYAKAANGKKLSQWITEHLDKISQPA